MKNSRKSKRKRPTLQEAEQFHELGIDAGMRTPDYISIAERKKRLECLSVDIENRLKKHLPRTRNLELVILKCHLLIEFMFNQYIDLIAPTEGLIEKERFSFKQKQTLMHMLGFPADPLLLPSTDLLNILRNQVAHTLSVDRKIIDKLIRLNAEDQKGCSRLTDPKRVAYLKQLTKFHCGMILGVIKGMHAAE